MSTPKDPLVRLGGIIRASRKSLGLGQQRVASAIGVTSAYISRLENGTALPSLAVIAGLARELGIDFDDAVRLVKAARTKIAEERLRAELRGVES